jgi:hypothetical protein
MVKPLAELFKQQESGWQADDDGAGGDASARGEEEAKHVGKGAAKGSEKKGRTKQSTN